MNEENKELEGLQKEAKIFFKISQKKNFIWSNECKPMNFTIKTARKQKSILYRFQFGYKDNKR